MSEKNRQKKLLVGAAIVIALLLGVVVTLLVNKASNEKKIAQQRIEINEVETLKSELQEEYDNAIAELDEALNENEKLRDDIEARKAELGRQRDKIAKILKAGKRSKSALADARSELNTLRLQQQKFLAKIDELEKTNSLLSSEIVHVKEEKKLVEEEVVKVRKQKEDVTTQKNAEIATAIQEKEKVAAEKAKLEREKNALKEKVNIASVIKVENVSVQGFKVRSNGKLRKKRYAKNIHLLKVCYKTTENLVAEKGREEFVVRIITPLGETMYIEDLGSGNFINKTTQEDARYTKTQDIAYEQSAANQCLNWKPDTPFARGNYQVEIYNKGYLAGTGTFRLR